MQETRHNVLSNRPTKLCAVAMGVAVVLALAASSPASAVPAQELVFHGTDALARLAEVVVGQGIEGVETSAVLTPDGSTVEWRVLEDRTDEAGERHLVYQQVLVPSRELAERLPARYSTRGIRMRGGVIGLHFEGAVPTMVLVSQYREPRLGSVPSILRPEVAFMEAHDAAAAQREGARSEWLERDAGELQSDLREVEAVIQPTTEGDLRLYWLVPTVNEEGQRQIVTLDAASHAIEAAESTQSWSTCVPGTSKVWATAIPQNPSIPNRSLMGGAVTAVGRTDGWSNEASWPGQSSQRPTVNVWMATDPGTSAFNCSPTYGNAGVLPLSAVGGTPTYGPDSTPALTGGKNVGKSSGDAIWHGYVVAAFLKTTFGVCGVDASCSPINIYMRWQDLWPTWRGYANWQADGSTGPLGVWVYPAGYNTGQSRTYPREASASLDVMGHEIGHGVINGWGQGLPNVVGSNGLTGAFIKGQLSEGFADVFGHTIEHKQHPAGSGFEKRDWMFGEDHMSTSASNMQYWRRVDANDQHSSYHKDHHPAGWNTDFYVQANMLPVALRLMAEGGANPACLPTPPAGFPASACTTLVTGVTLDKAAKILGGVVTLHGNEVTGWESVVQIAKAEAYRRYKRCTQTPPYNASAEQQAVRDAFTAIGYPDPSPLIQCP